MRILLKTILFYLFFMSLCYAKTIKYDLEIDYKEINFNGESIIGMVVNGSIPAPTLYFQEGDVAQIQVTNATDEDTSVHWHGLLLPNHQDGVPYVNHPPIEPGHSHLFTFKLRQSGTYWYHAHTGLQEQRGVYGAIVIYPKEETDIKFDKEEVVVLSDWINEDPDEVLRRLKSGSDYYSIKKGSKQNLVSAIQKKGLAYTFKQSLQRMSAMDISDIAYDLFLANGKPETIIPAQAGETIKLRLVNASAATYYTLAASHGERTRGLVVPSRRRSVVLSESER